MYGVDINAELGQTIDRLEYVIELLEGYDDEAAHLCVLAVSKARAAALIVEANESS